MVDENDKVFEAVELAKSSGKIKKGINEVTKAVEKGNAKLVVIAGDVNPAELTMHIPVLCKEKQVKCFTVNTKAELGAAAGIPVGTSAVAIVKEGDAAAIIKKLAEAE